MSADDNSFARRVADAKMAMRRQAVFSLAELWTLNPDEIEEGYRDGCEGFPCSDNRSRSYWHGWRKAQIDRGRLGVEWQDRVLVREVLAFGLLQLGEEHRQRYEWLKGLGLADEG